MLSDELDKILHEFNVKMGLEQDREIEAAVARSIEASECFYNDKTNALFYEKTLQLEKDLQLREAVEIGSEPTIRLYLKQGADVNCLDSAPLRIACTKNRFKIAAILLKNGARDNANGGALAIVADRNNEVLLNLLFTHLYYPKNVLVRERAKAENAGNYEIVQHLERYII